MGGLVSSKKKESEIIDLPLGNCIINYFYHCFDKFCLINSIQYNRGINNSNKLKIYLGKKNTKKIKIFPYIKQLKKIIEDNKRKKFADVKFVLIKKEKDYRTMFNTKDSSISEILIKILEVTPIQIAKIVGDEFEIMSNWDFLKNKLTKKESDVDEYINNTKFGMKDSIFEFFKLPVVVICCFGTQSIGKSTFLNELTGSIFNVSGMRCTEGIWMNVKIFTSYDEKDKITRKNCNNICNVCKKEKCYLYKSHNYKHQKQCICQKCICQKDCELKGTNICQKKCCFKKNHEELIKCSYPNCKCNCTCECLCEKTDTKDVKGHKHLCKDCKKNNEKECKCDCCCKHLCKIPILNHDFICVSLDFEGIGTMERKTEQDIQLALVGSAVGNNVMFRMNLFLDKFTENFLEQVYEGSKKIKNLDITQFFGGFICFSPKDVINDKQVKVDFENKLTDYINKKSESEKMDVNSE